MDSPITDAESNSEEPQSFDPATAPADMSDEELYNAYQYAKQFGPILRIDDLQVEIAQRWEEQHEP